MKYELKIACPKCGRAIAATAIVDPGVWTLPNGDPGYPGSTEIDFDPEGCECWRDEAVNDAIQAAGEAELARVQAADDGEFDYDASFENFADDDDHACPQCGGPLMPLGQLGAVVWSRCRNCGLDVSQGAP